MDTSWDKRNTRIIKVFKKILWPTIKVVFRLKVLGISNIKAVKNKPCLYVSNHNVGALIESHSALFLLQDTLGNTSVIYGFTHPSIFKIFGIKHYFEWIGAVPATYEIADNVFKSGNSLIIFPGGNEQALRPIWKYKENNFRKSHGWAKIAKKNQVTVVPITFSGSHFVNPILLSNEWLSKILILPHLLGLRITSLSIGQLIVSIVLFFLTNRIFNNLGFSLLIAYTGFILTPLAIIWPAQITMTIHPPIESHECPNEEILEDKVAKIMDAIYS